MSTRVWSPKLLYEPPAEAADIWRGIWFEEAHHSTAIEGNTLVLKQVEALLAEGRAVGDKALREYPSRSKDFHDKAQEAANSRLWGGIHWRKDNEVGIDVGRSGWLWSIGPRSTAPPSWAERRIRSRDQ